MLAALIMLAAATPGRLAVPLAAAGAASLVRLTLAARACLAVRGGRLPVANGRR